MFDVEALKRSIDCRELIERDLGQPKYRARDYSVYKCPLHHERKGYSLVVYADHWRCFGKCRTAGDVIGWLMRYHGLSFRTACERLASGSPIYHAAVVHPVRREEPLAQPPDEQWQKVARRIADAAADRLWSRQGRRALRYLKEVRGLQEDIIAAACLGFIPGDSHAWQEVDGLRVPCGITIPWYGDGAIWGIKVRRATGEQRYQQVSGGNLRGCLYLVDRVQPGMPLLVTEGEFDALTAWQLGWGKLSAVATGSASYARINPRWHGRLLSAPCLLVCMDADEAGQAAASQLASSSGVAHVISVPDQKDLNDYAQAVGSEAATEWLMRELLPL